MRQSKAGVTSKFQRYRRSKQRKGLKLLRLWVPNPHSTAFKRQVRHAVAVLRRAPEQVEATQFIWASADWSN